MASRLPAAVTETLFCDPVPENVAPLFVCRHGACVGACRPDQKSSYGRARNLGFQ